MKPISNDLRLRIIEAIQKNEDSQPEIAERFSVSLSFVEKLWHRFRTTGSYQAQPHAGGRERLLKDDEPLIRSEVAAQPDITLAELCETVALKTGKVEVSVMTMSAELKRLRLPRKKS
jgi:putative transposase